MVNWIDKELARRSAAADRKLKRLTEIREAIAKGLSLASIGRRFKVSRQRIWQIANGE